jgi:hypothetical protein
LLSLVQSALWVQGLGEFEPEVYRNKPGLPSTDEFDVKLAKVDSPLGEVTYLADPLRYSTMPHAVHGGQQLRA